MEGVVTSAWLLFFGIIFLVWIFGKREKTGHSVPDKRASRNAPQKLDTTRASPPTPSKLRPRSEPVCWVPTHETVNIKGFKIAGGMIYTGNVTRRTSATREFAHVIDPALIVDQQNSDTAGASVGYWPAYSQLRPRERRAYLQWLSEGRRTPGFSIGYAFLFLYGLEWRIFSERALEDAKSILIEIEALKVAYGDNTTFQSYADRFTAAVRVVSGDIPTSPPLVLNERYASELPFELRVALGRLLASGTLSGDWLLAWYLGQPFTVFRAAQRRCFDEFCRLFQIRFRERYPEGLALPQPRERLNLIYRPASGTAPVPLKGPHESWPDPAAAVGPMDIAKGIADECAQLLGSYSRYIGRAPTAKDTAQAQLLLPQELIDNSSPTFQKLKSSVDALIPSGAGEVAVDKLLNLAGLASGQKLNAAVLKSLAQVLGSVGVGLEPDPFSANTPVSKSTVVIFKAPSGAPVDNKRPAYLFARLLVEAGSLASTIEKETASACFEKLWAEISNLGGLGEAERLRLFAYLTSLRTNAPQQKKLLKRLSACSPAEAHTLGELVLRVVSAGKTMGVKEIAFAEQVYVALGLAKDRVYSHFQDVSSQQEGQGEDDLVVVSPALAGMSGVALPPQQTRATPITSNENRYPASSKPLVKDEPMKRFKDHENVDIPRITETGSPALVTVIDFDKLSRKRRESEEVSNILHRVFTENEPAAPVIEESESVAATLETAVDDRFLGLDRVYAELIEFFLRQDGHVGREEFEALAKKLGVFPDGAIEAINDWAFSQFDEALIEEGEPLVMQVHLLTQLQEAV